MPKEKKNGDRPYGAVLMVARKLEFPCSGTTTSPHARSLLVFSSNPTGHQPSSSSSFHSSFFFPTQQHGCGCCSDQIRVPLVIEIKSPPSTPPPISYLPSHYQIFYLIATERIAIDRNKSVAIDIFFCHRLEILLQYITNNATNMLSCDSQVVLPHLSEWVAISGNSYHQKLTLR